MHLLVNRLSSKHHYQLHDFQLLNSPDKELTLKLDFVG